MARKNVVSISTNVTPEQKEAIMEFATQKGVTEAQLVRMAVINYVNMLGGNLAFGEIKHGGNRKSKE